jgi:HEAT repeat protein
MQELADVTSKIQEQTGEPANEALIATLASPDGVQRIKAREHLVRIGKPAVAALIDALQSPSAHARWESAKALSELRDPRAAAALVDALEDEESAVRWLAARALVALGREALIPLLECVQKAADSSWMREGAHHVLQTLIREGVADEAIPVLEALEDLEPTIEAPVAAYNVLQVLRETVPTA